MSNRLEAFPWLSTKDEDYRPPTADEFLDNYMRLRGVYAVLQAKLLTLNTGEKQLSGNNTVALTGLVRYNPGESTPNFSSRALQSIGSPLSYRVQRVGAPEVSEFEVFLEKQTTEQKQAMLIARISISDCIEPLSIKEINYHRTNLEEFLGLSVAEQAMPENPYPFPSNYIPPAIRVLGMSINTGVAGRQGNFMHGHEASLLKELENWSEHNKIKTFGSLAINYGQVELDEVTDWSNVPANNRLMKCGGAATASTVAWWLDNYNGPLEKVRVQYRLQDGVMDRASLGLKTSGS